MFTQKEKFENRDETSKNTCSCHKFLLFPYLTIFLNLVKFNRTCDPEQNKSLTQWTKKLELPKNWAEQQFPCTRLICSKKQQYKMFFFS